jgi:hypothetical protein
VGDPVPGENLRKLAVIVTVMSILA